MRKKETNETQLSLFENHESEKEPNWVDFAKQRFEQNPNMSKEEYRRWIKYLINVSLRSLE